jgi:hypothetical protein
VRATRSRHAGSSAKLSDISEDGIMINDKGHIVDANKAPNAAFQIFLQ